jgi:hypothetical protein
MIMLKLLIALAIFCKPIVAFGQSTPTFYVFGENDDRDKDFSECLVTHKSSISAVQSALRYNQMNVSLSRDFEAIRAYININSMSALENSSACFYSISLEFSSYVIDVKTPAGAPTHGKIVFCDKASMLSWNRYTAQSQINNTLKIFVDECVAEMLEKSSS